MSVHGHTASPRGPVILWSGPRGASAQSLSEGGCGPHQGRSGVHWNYTYGYVPTEGDQSVDVYATGSWDDVRRGRIGGVCSPTTSGTSCSRAPAPHVRRSARTAVSVAGNHCAKNFLGNWCTWATTGTKDRSGNGETGSGFILASAGNWPPTTRCRVLGSRRAARPWWPGFVDIAQCRWRPLRLRCTMAGGSDE
ncbi:hypothetical protein RHA1_ro08774 (plasmid) [Rhodococcus jostii RHA1]|uniref:Uncharacterized protein n=1 Tax=Rhodococcus jostii (strain RHA1) TaxID=101510 RepID=Q0RY18_RHOJR|nr:hypothetical protein RHA1_ro08774 [Rhodococcus jostii RHA1]